MAVRTLTVVMDMDTGRATAKLDQAGRAIKQLGLDTRRSADNVRQMGRSFDSLGSGMQRPLHTLRDYVLVLGNLRFALMNVRDLAIGWVWGLMKQAGELERLTILMKGFSKATTEAGKTEEARNNLAMLMNQARNTGFEVKALADAFVKFQSADLNPVTYSMRGLTEAVAKFGGNSDIMHRASIAIQQMAGKGKISMEELRQQLGEAVPSAMAIMARSLGVTVAKLGDEIKKGHVKAKPALELMLRDMEVQFAGSGKALANSFFGQIAQLKTNMMNLSAEFVGMGRTDGLFAGAKQSMEELNRLMMSGEGREAMMSLGQSIASIASALANTVKFIVEWRSEIGTLVVTLGKLWLVMKGAQVFAWMVSMGKTAADAFRNMGNAAIQSEGHIGDWIKGSDRLVGSVDRQREATGRLLQMRQNQLSTAQQALSSTQAEIQKLTDLGKTYGQNITMLQAQQRQERSNLQTAQTLHAANIAAGRSGATSALMVKQAQDQLNTTTRSLISQQRLQRATTEGLTLAQQRLALQENAVTAATTRMSLAERANAISKGFMASAARAAQGSIGLLIAAVNLETGAVARATLAERAGAVAKGLYATAARAAGVAAGFMGRMASMALGPIGMIGLAAYEAAKYFGFFTNKANEAADAAANLAGQMANLNNIKTIQARIDEIDTTLGQNGKYDFWRTNVFTTSGQRKKLEDERARLSASMGNSTNAYSNNGRDYATAAGYKVDQRVDTLRTEIRLLNERENIAARVAAGDKEAIRIDAQRRDSVVARERQMVENLVRMNTARYEAAKKSGDRNGMADYSARVTALTQRLEGLQQAGSSAALQLEAFTAGGEGGGPGKGKGSLGKIANNVAGLTGAITGLEEKLKGDVSVKLKEFEATLAAGGFKGKTQQEIDLMRRKAALEDALTDSKRSTASENSYENTLASMTGRLAELNDELIGGTGNLAKFEAQVKAGKFDGLAGDQIEKLRATAAALDDAEKQLRIKSLDDDIAKAGAEADALWRNYAAGAELSSTKVEKLKAQFADKRVGLTGDDLKKIDEKIAELVAKLQSVEVAKNAQQWADEAQQNDLELLPEQERAQREFEIERDKRWKIVMETQAGTDERRRIEEAYYRWKESAERKVQRQNEHAVVKMMRDWANLGQNIQQWMAGAISSFVDKLAEGKFAFKDFAKEMLKQLLKIIIQALIAYAILSAIGAAPPGGFGGFMKSQIGAGFGVPMGGGETPAGQNHHGGMVGDNFGLRTVSSAMLKMADRYHTGGGISKLGPKEVPLIGLEGERVLNEEQQRQLGKDMAEAGSSKAPPVTVQIINNGEPVSAEASEPQFDGKEFVVGIVIDQLNKQGRLRDAVAAVGKQ